MNDARVIMSDNEKGCMLLDLRTVGAAHVSEEVRREAYLILKSEYIVFGKQALLFDQEAERARVRKAEAEAEAAKKEVAQKMASGKGQRPQPHQRKRSRVLDQGLRMEQMHGLTLRAMPVRSKSQQWWRRTHRTRSSATRTRTWNPNL
jgi:hypothetical protein